MLTMTTKLGRPPLPDGQRGRAVHLYLSAPALAALAALAGTGNQSELVSKLLVAEQKTPRLEGI